MDQSLNLAEHHLIFERAWVKTIQHVIYRYTQILENIRDIEVVEREIYIYII